MSYQTATNKNNSLNYLNQQGAFDFNRAFTLVELLVVLAVLSTLIALILPGLTRAREAARKMVCQGRLRQIAVAWQLYLENNEGAFYQGLNHNSDFGGWRGQTNVVSRPLNTYLGLPTDSNTPAGMKVFECPSDTGSYNYPDKFFHTLGNSFQTNILLIGPDQLPTQYGLEWTRIINAEINGHLKHLTIDRVSNHSRLLLLGDLCWLSQWDPLWTYSCGKAWHGRRHYYNFAFLDGHAGYIEIRKGLYLGPDYRVQPFSEFDDIVNEHQEEVDCWCTGKNTLY